MEKLQKLKKLIKKETIKQREEIRSKLGELKGENFDKKKKK